ncbi:MAG: OmpA family protein [Smithellaceae bacterium]
MTAMTTKRMFTMIIALFFMSFMIGCSILHKDMEKGSKEREGGFNKAGYSYWHRPLPEADRNLNEARSAGKDKECPAEFNAAKDMVDKAHAIYVACHTEEAIAIAKEANIRIKDLCPAKAKPVAPLAVPVNLSAKAVSASQINVDWNPVEGASGYKIYRDDVYLTTSKTPLLSDDGLKAGTEYCYYAIAISDGERISDKSNRACATTLAVAKEVEQKQEAASAAATVAAEPQRATINIEFDTNKSNVKSKYNAEIKKFADLMKQNPDLKLIIEGHTDNLGQAKKNLLLSQKRANSVRDYMIRNFGIEASRIKAEGYGITKPIASNKTKEGRQKNRRVEAVTYK